MKLALASSDFEENTITFLVPEAVMLDMGFYPCELEVGVEELMKHPPKKAEPAPERGGGNMKISTDLWFDVARAKAESVVQDPEDRKLLAPETYDIIHAVDYPHMAASGIYGDYVEIEAFQQLGDRFLMAWELIKTMESNSPESPDSSPRDCDTCRHWGGWSKNCGFCHNRSKWEGRSAPEPRPAKEPAPSPSEECETVAEELDYFEGVIGRLEAGMQHNQFAVGIAIDLRSSLRSLRSQLARKDEGMGETCCPECGVAGGYHQSRCSLVGTGRAALREPDGRKG